MLPPRAPAGGHQGRCHPFAPWRLSPGDGRRCSAIPAAQPCFGSFAWYRSQVILCRRYWLRTRAASYALGVPLRRLGRCRTQADGLDFGSYPPMSPGTPRRKSRRSKAKRRKGKPITEGQPPPASSCFRGVRQRPWVSGTESRRGKSSGVVPHGPRRCLPLQCRASGRRRSGTPARV